MFLCHITLNYIHFVCPTKLKMGEYNHNRGFGKMNLIGNGKMSPGNVVLTALVSIHEAESHSVRCVTGHLAPGP